MQETDIINPVLTRQEIKLITNTLIKTQEWLLKLKLEESRPDQDIVGTIEQYSHVISQLHSQSLRKTGSTVTTGTGSNVY